MSNKQPKEPRVPRTKRRVRQHIMEDRSTILFRSLIPEEWAVHEYGPDYGIDLVVEIFKYVDEEQEKADTLGDLFFVQLKSVKKTTIQKLVVRPRGNVEKAIKTSSSSESMEIEVIPFQLDSDELMTVQAMSPGVPVLLVLVCLDLNRTFFVCLNDYIDKVILPEDPAYSEQGSKTIHIPVKNEIKNEPVALVPLRFYAKRAKLYAAFTKFLYQRSELERILHFRDVEPGEGHDEVHAMFAREAAETDLRAMLRHFVALIKRLPIWTEIEMWAIVEDYRRMVTFVEEMLADESLDEETLSGAAWQLWHGLTVLASNFEECCREWFLPTYLAQLSSYPD
jgi:uncharacterized protein DUF4365